MTVVPFRPRSTIQIDITDQLVTRPNRLIDPTVLAAADRELDQLPPLQVLQRLSQIAVDLCRSGSAGISLLEADEDMNLILRWAFVAGLLKKHTGAVMLRDDSPCGLCLSAGQPILLSRPFQKFRSLRTLSYPIQEILLLPLHGRDGQALGALWVAHHDAHSQFRKEELQALTLLILHAVEAIHAAAHFSAKP